MLDMRPNCELCDKDLPADKAGAVICSFECTFCTACVDEVCPNCKGQLTVRPTRMGDALTRFPASTKRVLKASKP